MAVTRTLSKIFLGTFSGVVLGPMIADLVLVLNGVLQGRDPAQVDYFKWPWNLVFSLGAMAGILVALTIGDRSVHRIFEFLCLALAIGIAMYVIVSKF